MKGRSTLSPSPLKVLNEGVEEEGSGEEEVDEGDNNDESLVN